MVTANKVRTCSPDATLDAVAQIMWENDSDSVPVIDADGGLIGVVTGYDMLLAAKRSRKPLWELTAREVINAKHYPTGSAGDNVSPALRTTKTEKGRCTHVVDDWVIFKILL